MNGHEHFVLSTAELSSMSLLQMLSSFEKDHSEVYFRNTFYLLLFITFDGKDSMTEVLEVDLPLSFGVQEGGQCLDLDEDQGGIHVG